MHESLGLGPKQWSMDVWRRFLRCDLGFRSRVLSSDLGFLVQVVCLWKPRP